MLFLNYIHYNEQSILRAKDIVLWKQKQHSYNFKSLPKTVILTPNTSFINRFKKITTKKAKGLSGKNYILNPHYLLSFQFGIGAPAIISHLEELKVLGVENFIFIGFAGILNNEITHNKAYHISTAFSASGTSYFYKREEEISQNNTFSTLLKSKLQLSEATCISTDVPYRETKSFLTNYLNKGAQLIDMETASIIAFSNYYNVNSMCILIASDTLTNFVWSPPKNMSVLLKKIDILIKNITQ